MAQRHHRRHGGRPARRRAQQVRLLQLPLAPGGRRRDRRTTGGLNHERAARVLPLLVRTGRACAQPLTGCAGAAPAPAPAPICSRSARPRRFDPACSGRAGSSAPLLLPSLSLAYADPASPPSCRPQDPHRIPHWYQKYMLQYQSSVGVHVIEDRFQGEPHPPVRLAGWMSRRAGWVGGLAPHALRAAAPRWTSPAPLRP